MEIKVKLTRAQNYQYYQVDKDYVVSVDLQTYIAGVVAGQMGNAKIQAAKAQAIAARTYAYPYYSKGLTITDTSQHQAFRVGRVVDGKYPNAILASQQTDGMLLAYNSKVINSCPYSSSNGGRTVSSEQRWGGYRAWLIEQDDPWDKANNGDGSGHGVGMSQVGCHYAARIGKTYQQILSFYYPGTVIIKQEDEAMPNTIETKADAIEKYAESCIGCPYIYGATAKKCTPQYRRARAAQYPNYYDNIVNYCQALKSGKSCNGCKWEGMLAYDCAQLTRWAYNAAGYSLPSGATSQWKTVSWENKGTISTLPKNKTCSLFVQKDGKMTHTGILLRDGRVIDARGHRDGVVVSESMQKCTVKWTHWAYAPNLDKQTDYVTESYPKLKNGSKGQDVIKLQQLLIVAGFPIVPDGVFGKATEAAVKEYQKNNGLTVDGICGTNTWTKLLQLQEILVPQQTQQLPQQSQPAVNTEDKHTYTLQQRVDILQKQIKQLLQLMKTAR